MLHTSNEKGMFRLYISGIHSDILLPLRGRSRIDLVFFWFGKTCIDVSGCSLLVLHIDYTDIPPRLALSNQIEASIMHPSLYMEIEMVHFNVYNQQGGE